MPANILVILSHPTLEHSRVNQRLILEAKSHPQVEISDLYEQYPDFHIDVKWEQHRITEYDVLVFQHPIYWYSCPSLMKEWIDLVLAYNYAYGPEGKALESKTWLSVVSTGGNQSSYEEEGLHNHSLEDFLKPFKFTAKLCNMKYETPKIVYNAHKLTSETLERAAKDYRECLDELAQISSES